MPVKKTPCTMYNVHVYIYVYMVVLSHNQVSEPGSQNLKEKFYIAIFLSVGSTVLGWPHSRGPSNVLPSLSQLLLLRLYGSKPA